MTSWQPSLAAWARQRLGEPLAPWWEKHTQGAFDKTGFLAALSGSGRRFGSGTVLMPADGAQILESAGLFAQGRPWAELGRVALLLSLPGRVPQEDLAAVIEEAYRTGDLGEKQAVLRALPHLPEPQCFVAIAAEGARANALSIFEALASHNLYPATHFSDPALNQLVMKALFNDVPLRTVLGLKPRMNADLVRIARDYGNERRAAGRPISEDLAMLEAESFSS